MIVPSHKPCSTGAASPAVGHGSLRSTQPVGCSPLHSCDWCCTHCNSNGSTHSMSIQYSGYTPQTQTSSKDKFNCFWHSQSVVWAKHWPVHEARHQLEWPAKTPVPVSTNAEHSRPRAGPLSGSAINHTPVMQPAMKAIHVDYSEGLAARALATDLQAGLCCFQAAT